MLLPFKYESSMNGFNDIIEDLSSYYSDIQLSIGFISDVQDVLHNLRLELPKFYHKLKDARVFTTEKGDPVSSMGFYRELFAEVAHEPQQNVENMSQVARERELAVQSVFVEIPFEPLRPRPIHKT